MKEGNKVRVTDKYKTTNGKHENLIGKIVHIDYDSSYPITVSFDGNELECFNKNELTLI